MSENILIAPAGWEERFVDGVLLDIDEFSPSKILIPYSNEYADRTFRYREKIAEKARYLKIEYIEKELDYSDSVVLYKSLLNFLENNNVFFSTCVRFNITTSPREIIWYILHFLSEKKNRTQFTYFRPKSYGDYISRDARPPRLVLKRSGIAYPDKPTCILALAGYDIERLQHLLQRFEPKLMFIACQTGDQFENHSRQQTIKNLESETILHIDFDCYDLSDNAVHFLFNYLQEYLEEYNIIAASLGPKPGALTLFKLTQLCPEIGLVYIPSGDYSEKYSVGTDLDSKTFTEIIW